MKFILMENRIPSLCNNLNPIMLLNNKVYQRTGVIKTFNIFEINMKAIYVGNI
jgi:hypothetical protein